MCYAFSDTINGSTEAVIVAHHEFDREAQVVNTTTRDSTSQKTSLKRPADDTLEREQPKVAKVSHDDEDIQEVGMSDAVDPQDKEIHRLTERLIKANERGKDWFQQFHKLQETFENLKQRHDAQRYDLLEFQLKASKQKEKAEAERKEARDIAQQTVKKSEDLLHAQWSKKIAALKAKHEDSLETLKEKSEDKIEDLKDKHAEQVAKKDEEYKRRATEIKARNQQLEKDMKEAKVKHAQAEKEMKAEHQKAQREMKADFQEELKSYKPDHSKLVKEKDSLLREKQREIAALGKARDEAKDEAENLRSSLIDVEAHKDKCETITKAAIAKNKDLRNTIRIQVEQSKQAIAAKDEQIDKYKTKLAAAGVQWDAQNDKLVKHTQELLEQQRANFVLKSGMNRKDARIQELENQLLTAGKGSIELSSGNPLESKTFTQNPDGVSMVHHDANATSSAEL